MAASSPSLGLQLMKRFRSFALPHNHTEVIEDVRARVRDVAASCVNRGEVELFGSHVTGFCKPDSDADLSLTYRNFSPFLQGLPRVDEQDGKKLVRFSKEAPSHGMQNVRYIQARIPVVQFIDGASGLACDLSIGNFGGVENSKMLRLIHNVHPDLLGAYVFAVKEWGKAREVIAPDKQTFNSFTMTTMALMVAQELSVIPAFDNPSGDFGELTVPDVEAKLADWQLPKPYQNLKSDEQLGEALEFMLRAFSQYYSQFNFAVGTVSLICPRRLRKVYAATVDNHLKLLSSRKRDEWEKYVANSKEPCAYTADDFAAAIKNEATQRVHDSPFVVEDCANFVNCGRRVLATRVPMVKAEFERLRKLMEAKGTSADELLTVSRTLTRHHFPDDKKRVREFA